MMSNIYQLENSVWPTLLAQLDFNEEESLYNEEESLALMLNKGKLVEST